MSRDEEHGGFAALVTAIVALGMIAGLVATVAELDPRARTAVICVFTWVVVLLPVHELGHAIVARLCGGTIERISLGYGKVVHDGELLGARLVVRAYPVQGFVRIEGLHRLRTAAVVAIYAAGVGAEALVVGVAALVAGPAQLFRGDTALPVVIAESGVMWLALSAIANLIPRQAVTEPNGRGGETNDGLAILQALRARP